MYIVWMLDEIICSYQLGPFDLWWFSSTISLVIFCLDDLTIGDRGILKSPTTTVLSLYVFLGSSEYVWWNWVHWHWVHISW
jgi:hypothetical protein